MHYRSSNRHLRGILAFLVINQLNPRIGLAEEYHDAAHGFRLEPPARWKAIPADALRLMRDSLLRNDAKREVNFVAGFQRSKGDHWFTYPYILVQVLPYSQFGWTGQPADEDLPDVVKLITGIDLSGTLDKAMKKHLRGTMSAPKTGQATLDPQNRRFNWPIEMNVSGFGLIQGETTGYFGRVALIQVSFYAEPDDFKELEEDRTKLWNSFRFDGASAFDVSQANPLDRATPLQRIVKHSIIGAVVGIIAAGVIGALRVRKRSKERDL